LPGNIAVFSNKEELTGQETKGVIELSEDGSLTIHLFETLLMENGSYFTYPTWNSFEEAEQAYYNAMAQILLMNDDQRGWVLPLYDEYPEYNAVGRTYLRFYENGTVDCWISEEIGGDVIYECHSGAYWVDKNTLYIDGNPYEFFGETTGITYMQLSALGSYALDFSGYYWCEQNEMYAFLYGNLG